MNLESIAKYFAPKSPMLSNSHELQHLMLLPEQTLWPPLAWLMLSAVSASTSPGEDRSKRT
jgi:hypothetical protein